MREELARFGAKAVEIGLVHAHFGNVSARVGDRLLISRSGSMLDELEPNGIVEVELDRPTAFDIVASSETVVHRRVYQETSALAILHVHSPYAVAVSLMARAGDRIVPEDSESRYFLHEIPIIEAGVGSTELARSAAEALSQHRGLIVRGHGSFAVGKIVEEAFVHACSLEHACKVLYLTRMGRAAGLTVID
jgi:L-fuculose-phosphate aldolase